MADQPTGLIETPPRHDRFALFADLRNTSRKLSPHDIDFLELRYYPPPGSGRFNPILNFGIYAFPGAITADYVSARPPLLDLVSESGFDQINRWTEECQRTHSACPGQERTLPTRVLELTTMNGSEYLKLYISRGETERYVALSYCWGGPQSIMLTRATMADMQNGVPLKAFPETLRDAVFVTKKLGMNYLWVDALCIVQDDKNDMTQELKSMAQTYHNAFLTISAASASGSREGFLQPRKPQKSRYPKFVLPYRAWDSASVAPGSVVVGEHKMYDAQKEPINQRAWTLQERLLSRRVVIYGTHQLLWQCQHGQQIAGGADSWYDGGTQRLDPSFFSPSMTIKAKEFEYTWIDTVIDYSHRKASVEADKLVALGAVASTFQQNSAGDRYLAGLWGRDLCHYLLWMLDPSIGQALQPRPSIYVAPSWSWASTNGVVAFGGSARDTEGPQMQILQCQTTLDDPQLDTGRVTGGFLDIRGSLRKTAWASPSTLLESTESHSSPIGKFWMDAVEDKPQTVFCLRVDSDTGLVLAPFNPPDFPNEHGLCFRRIGMFEMTEGCKSQDDRAKICNEWFMRCEKRTVRIR